MATTTGISSLTRYPALADSGVLGLVAGSTAASQRNTELFDAVKLVYQTRSQFKADQTAYRQQVRGFSADSRSLYGSALSLSYLPVKPDAATTLQAVKSTLGTYNTLTSSLQKAGNLTTAGGTLLGQLNNAFAAKADDLKAIGITKNETSGLWTVDDSKFKDAVAKTPQKVSDTLGSQGVGGSLAAALKPGIGQPASDLFKMPAPVAQNPALKSMFSRGIFLDLLA